MTKIIERTASSIGELIDRVREISESWTSSPSDAQDLWFRGQGKRSQKLLPEIYRPDSVQLSGQEVSLFEMFKAYGAAYTLRQPTDEWDWYFLSRHHGLTTRLLDWTENLLVATYFAIGEKTINGFKSGDGRHNITANAVFDDESPVVWLFEAAHLNIISMKFDGVITVGEKYSNEYLPSGLQRSQHQQNRYPIAVFPARSNLRIVAQHGCFTLHGHDLHGLDELYETIPEMQTLQLGRIVLDRANLRRFADDLGVLGMNRLALFPDLDSVAYHVNSMYRF